MCIIADLHGGDPNDPIAIAEFQEIQEKVQLEVSSSRLGMARSAADSTWTPSVYVRRNENVCNHVEEISTASAPRNVFPRLCAAREFLVVAMPSSY
jgi:hypothetical protein